MRLIKGKYLLEKGFVVIEGCDNREKVVKEREYSKELYFNIDLFLSFSTMSIFTPVYDHQIGDQHIVEEREKKWAVIGNYVSEEPHPYDIQKPREPIVILDDKFSSEEEAEKWLEEKAIEWSK